MRDGNEMHATFVNTRTISKYSSISLISFYLFYKNRYLKPSITAAICLARFLCYFLCLFLMVKKRQSSSRGGNLGQSENPNSNSSRWFKIVSDLHPPGSSERFSFVYLFNMSKINFFMC